MAQIQTQAQKRVVLEYAAHNDVLTGLKNRAGLIASLENVLGNDPTHNQHFSLYFMDLDGFKKINDHYGHAAGDEVLKAAARNILACTRSSDIVARIGGDEFVVASQSAPSEGDVTVLAQRINAAFLVPIHVDGNDLLVGISVGIAKYPQDGTTIDELLAHSDSAMYIDKQKKKDTV